MCAPGDSEDPGPLPTPTPAHAARRDLEGAPSPPGNRLAPEPVPRPPPAPPAPRALLSAPGGGPSPTRGPPAVRTSLPSYAKQAPRRPPFRTSRGDYQALGAGPTTRGAAWATRALDEHQPRVAAAGTPGLGRRKSSGVSRVRPQTRPPLAESCAGPTEEAVLRAAATRRRRDGAPLLARPPARRKNAERSGGGRAGGQFP